MIFTFFIAAVFASQSFRGIVNGADDTVTGEYKKEKMITIWHEGYTSTKSNENKLGYGTGEVGKLASFAVDPVTPLDYKSTDPYTAEADFDYLPFLKSQNKALIITNKGNMTIAVDDAFKPRIKAESVTLGAYDGDKGYIEIREDTAHSNGKLFYYKSDANSAELTHNDKKFSGMIDLSNIDLTESSVNLGYVSATNAGGKLASSGIINAQKVVTPAPTYSINDNGKVEFTTTPVDTTYQEFDGDLNKKEQVVVTTGNAKKEVDTTDEYHFWYAKYEAGTLSNIQKVDLKKAPEVTLSIIDQTNKVVPKLQIVGGKTLAGTELKLNNVPDGEELSITLDADGNSDEYVWTKFKKVAGKKGSIYLKKSGIIDSVAWVIEDAKFTLKKKDKNAEKISIDFTMQSGMIKDMPTNLCIYAQDKDGKIIEDSVDFLPMEWEEKDAYKKSFEYELAKFVLKDNYYAVMTASDDKAKIKTEPLSAPILVHGTEPVDPSGGAFSAVATIFAALVSLIVFTF